MMPSDLRALVRPLPMIQFFLHRLGHRFQIITFKPSTRIPENGRGSALEAFTLYNASHHPQTLMRRE
jgi:hypothetical protein